MPVLRTLCVLRSTMLAGAATGIAVLAVLAARADAGVAGGNPRLTFQDLAVGFAFPLAAGLATGPAGQRLLIAAVGPAWLAGSVSPAALSLHQAVLLVSLAVYPAARVRGALGLLIVAAAVLVAGELVPQLGVAALFAAVAATTFAAAGQHKAQAAYPICAAGTVAAVLAFSWWSVRRDPASSPVMVYEFALIAVAVAFPFATRALTRFRSALADRVIGDARFAGLPGLRLVLAGVLDDATLRIDLCDTRTGQLLRSSEGHEETPGVFRLRVLDGARPLACVSTRSRALTDRPTSNAVDAAVRLAVINDGLRREETERVAEVERSRVRLLAAADRERERIAARLRAGAGRGLDEAESRLAAVPSAGDPELAALINFASIEVAAAAAEVGRIAVGAPPSALGVGGLAAAIESLTGRCPLPVTVSVSDDASADSATETALFYACSEALANATKHSGAAHIDVDLRSECQWVVLAIRDDGVGGAEATGSGLQGLADRLSTVGGHVEVSSPVGGGTTITAMVPRDRP